MASTAASRGTSILDSLASASLPVQAVLRTPELLELIFLHIRQRALLTSVQRVNHWFNAVILTSPCLQAHLFFRPHRPIHWDSVEINQMVADLLPVSFDPASMLMKSQRFYWEPHTPREPGVLQCQCTASRTVVKCLPQEEQEEEADEDACQWGPNTAWCRPGASWRRMLVLQPTKSQEGEAFSEHHRVVVNPSSPDAFLAGHQRLVMEDLLSQARHKSDNATHVVLLLQFCNDMGKVTPLNIFLTKRLLHGGGNMTYLQAGFTPFEQGRQRGIKD